MREMRENEDTSFLEGSESEVSEVTLNDIQTAVDDYVQMLLKMEEIDESKKALSASIKAYSEEIIPNLLTRCGLESITTASGQKITVKEEVFARIPTDPTKRAEALSWLRNNGGEDLIGEELIIEAPDEEVKKQIAQLGVDYSTTVSVNTNSLLAFFREALGIKKGSTQRINYTDAAPALGLYVYKKTMIKE